MKILATLLCCIYGCFAASFQTGSTCPGTCEARYTPVCGNDGKTYANICFFNDAKCHNNRLVLRHVGACPGFGSHQMPVCNPGLVSCPRCWSPICALDGKTYSSQCVLDARNCGTNIIKVNHTGGCGDDQLAS